MKKTRKLLKNKNGFTLLEVTVAMLILALGILGIAPLVVVSMYGNSYSQEVTSANVMAQDRIEQLKNQAVISPIPFIETSSLTNLGLSYSRTTRVDDNSSDGTVPAGLYKIQVTMTWTDKENKQRSIIYSTYKAK